jgi:hypothetical protein
MTHVTIHDEATRRVVLASLWYAVAGRAGMNFEEVGWGAAIETLWDEDNGHADELEEIIRDCAAMASTANRVREATLGTSLDVCLTDEQWVDGIDGAIHQAEGSDGFAAASVDTRAKLLAGRDAAVRLQAELNPTEAMT